MESLFQNILIRDEKIIKTIKPNKFKFLFSYSVWAFVVLALFALVGVLTCTIRDDAGALAPIAVTITIFALGAVVAMGIIVMAILSYVKRYYAITNKRILIRCGVFAACYKTLDMDKIGAINVNTSLFDKMLGQKTGSISLGSLASPITPDGAFYELAAVVDTYDLYQEIKAIIIQNQQPQATSKKRYISKQKSED